jgi:hypothetical protein
VARGRAMITIMVPQTGVLMHRRIVRKII